MRFCSNHNFTITWAALKLKNSPFFYSDQDGYPRGKYADYVLKHFFLVEPEIAKKNCRFLWSDKVGKYYPSNDSFDGVLQLIVESKVDSFIRPMDFFSEERFFDFSNVLLSRSFNTLQLIDKKFKNEDDDRTLMKLIDFLIPSLGFVLMILISLVLYFILRFLFGSVKTPLLIQFKRRNSRIKIISIFYLVFIFLMRVFFANNLNTSNVIVDTSDLLHNKEKLLETKKEFCFPEENLDVIRFREATNGSLMNRLYEKRNKESLCVLFSDNRLGNLLEKDKNNIFLMIPNLGRLITSKVVQTLFKKDTFINDFSFYTTLRTYLLRKNLKKEIKNYFNKCTDFYLTFGFLQKMITDPPNYTNLQLVKSMGTEDAYRTYTNLQDYIEDNTFIGPLSFSKLDYLFRIYFILLISIFCINMTHFLLKSFKLN